MGYSWPFIRQEQGMFPWVSWDSWQSGTMFKFPPLYSRVYAVGVLTMDLTEYQEMLDWMVGYTQMHLHTE